MNIILCFFIFVFFLSYSPYSYLTKLIDTLDSCCLHDTITGFITEVILFFRNMNNMKGFFSQVHLALNAHFNAQFVGIVQEIESLVGSYCHMIMSIYAFISNR